MLRRFGKKDDCIAIVQRPSNGARTFALPDDGTERIVMGARIPRKQRARQHGRRALLYFIRVFSDQIASSRDHDPRDKSGLTGEQQRFG
jgi:hypothetical protein